MKVQFSSIAAAASLLKVAASFTARMPDARTYMRLDATAGGLTAATIGDEGQFVITIPGVEVEKPGTIIARADLLAGLFAKSTHGEFGVLSVKEGDASAPAELRVGKNRYTLRQPPAVDVIFNLPGDTPTGGATMPAKKFVEALQFVSHAMARNDVRYYLNGCCIVVGTRTIDFAATDGHRLARTIEMIDGAAERTGAGAVLVPNAAVSKIANALNATGDGNVRLVQTGNGYCLCTESFALYGKSLEGRFPDVGAVIPKEHEAVATISAPALVRALDRTGLVSAGQKHHYVDCAAYDDELVFTIDCDNGAVEERIPAQFDGAAVAVNFRVDAHYLRDAAAVGGAGGLQIMVASNPNQPIRWACDGIAPDLRGGVIMPVRR